MSRPSTQPPPTDDPANQLFAASALDFLLIELVPLAQRITEQLLAHEQALEDEYKRSRIFNRTASKTPAGHKATASNSQEAGAEQTEGGEESTVTCLGFPPMSDKTRSGVLYRLDGMGYRVGQGLVERFSTNKPRPTTPLDAIKFLCKDLWLLVFRKQIDNLKTNHRGIFVLTDNRFQPLSRMSIDRRAPGRAGITDARVAEEAILRAQTYLYFPSGIIRGVLAGFGIEATVEGASTAIPTATFQIKTKGAKP